MGSLYLNSQCAGGGGGGGGGGGNNKNDARIGSGECSGCRQVAAYAAYAPAVARQASSDRHNWIDVHVCAVVVCDSVSPCLCICVSVSSVCVV